MFGCRRTVGEGGQAQPTKQLGLHRMIANMLENHKQDIRPFSFAGCWLY